MLYLNPDETRQALPMPDAVAAMRVAFTGDAETPLRSLLGGSLVMPGRLDGDIAIKVVSTVPGNPAGLVILFGPDGSPVGVVDGPTLTAIRTGAVSGLATDLLASANSSSLAMLGAGAMAFDQVEAVRAVRPLTRILVWSRSAEHAHALASRVGGDAVADADAAVADCEIVSCATPASSPLFHEDSVRAGTHINAVGAFRPEMVEVPSGVLDRAYVVVDDVEAASVEAGDLIQADREANATLNQLLTDKHPAIGEDVTVFKSVGIAAQDVAAARVALDNASRQGIGTQLG